MEITCYRNPELMRVTRFLPARAYNLAWTMLARSQSGNLFVPLRDVQYLAIIDAEEFVFLDGARKCWIDIAWRNLRPQARSSLEDPVAYDAVYYHPDAETLMLRLQVELPRALLALADKTPYDGPSRVIKFPAPGVH
ncbi:MAG TPA: hypothetical protein VFN66_06160 [Burkholderiales bacterium]|nr:hypothetical protein [Burkholderiales bacterium]